MTRMMAGITTHGFEATAVAMTAMQRSSSYIDKEYKTVHVTLYHWLLKNLSCK